MRPLYPLRRRAQLSKCTYWCIPGSWYTLVVDEPHSVAPTPTSGGCPMTDRVRLVSVAAALPPRSRSSAEVEALIQAHSPGYRVRSGVIAALSGVETRRVAEEHVQCSDLAADAALRALADARMRPEQIDALIFAAAGQDLIE